MLKKIMIRFTAFITCLALFSMPVCAAQKEDRDRVERVIASMSLEEKIAQLFVTRPEYSEGYPVAGIYLFGKNITTPEEVMEVTSVKTKIPIFVGVDEEGGGISRVANNKAMGVIRVPSMLEVGNNLTLEQIEYTGAYMGNYLHRYGFNMNSAPVVDVFSNPDNTVIAKRAFSTEAKKVGPAAGAFIKGLHSQGVMCCLKHFPGHGDTSQDTHDGTVFVYKTWEELMQCELLPYLELLGETDMVMTAHITCPNITTDNLPATLSYQMLTGKLRGELGYDGVIISDGMEMKAINDRFSGGRASVMFIKAGGDIILVPLDIHESFAAILEAVRTGELTEDRIDESLRRILSLKDRWGMLNEL